MKKVVLMSVFSLFFITGCNIYGGGLIIEPGYSYGYNTPPAHARAHGRRAHLYHYYPNAEFYFDTGRNMYYFLDSNLRWTFSVNLPYRLRHHLHNNYVEIEMNDDRPYRQHKYYKNKYRKDKSKYNRKNNSRNSNNENRKNKYNSQTLNGGTRHNRTYEKQDSEKSSRHDNRYKNKKYNEDDGRDSKKSKKDRNKY